MNFGSKRADAMLLEARVAIVEQDYVLALNRLERAVQLAPSAETFVALAELLERLERFHEAIDAALDAIQLDHSYPDAYHVMGRCLFETGEEDEALEWLAMANESPASKPGYRKSLGGFFARRNRWFEAFAFFQAEVTHFPETPECHHQLDIARERLFESVANLS